MKNVYLIGMMGSGKTTSGKALAEMLSLKFVDLDERIVDKAKHSINEIFKTQGEAYFRNMETEILDEVSRTQDQVVATGGGIVLNPSNNARMKNTGTVIYLKANLDVLWERIKKKTDRPLLQTENPKQTLIELFGTRAPFYEQSCHKVFLTDHKSSREVAEEIYQNCFAGQQ